MPKKFDREPVAWITRGGKHVPIFDEDEGKKEVWEMTQKEIDENYADIYNDDRYKRLGEIETELEKEGGKIKGFNKGGRLTDSTFKKMVSRQDMALELFRIEQIKKAISKGKKIPKNVLKEYNSLLATYKKK